MDDKIIEMSRAEYREAGRKPLRFRVTERISFTIASWFAAIHLSDVKIDAKYGAAGLIGIVWFLLHQYPI